MFLNGTKKQKKNKNQETDGYETDKRPKTEKLKRKEITLTEKLEKKETVFFFILFYCSFTAHVLTGCNKAQLAYTESTATVCSCVCLVVFFPFYLTCARALTRRNEL